MYTVEVRMDTVWGGDAEAGNFEDPFKANM